MRSNSHDLPLLAWSPSSKVIPFPASRRIGKVRRVAEVLLRSNPRAAEAYWRRITADLARPLSQAGIHRDVIEAEITAFRETVQRELLRRRGNAA